MVAWSLDGWWRGAENFGIAWSTSGSCLSREEGVTVQIRVVASGRRRVGALVGVRSARKRGPTASLSGGLWPLRKPGARTRQFSLEAAGPPLPLPCAEPACPREACPRPCSRASSLRLPTARRAALRRARVRRCNASSKKTTCSTPSFKDCRAKLGRWLRQLLPSSQLGAPTERASPRQRCPRRLCVRYMSR